MKKTAFKTLWFLPLIFITYACLNTKTIDDHYFINVTNAIKTTPVDFNLSEITDKIEYVKLQTKPGVALRFIQKLHVSENHIYVSDRKGLFKFDLNGMFVAEIGRMGNGPGEHNGNIRFAICDITNEIYIYNNFKNINVYDQHTGMFLREFTVENHVCDVVVPDKDHIALLTWDPDRDLNPDEVIFMNKEGKIKATIKNYNRSEIKGNVAAYASNYQMNDELRYLYIYNDTLYKISSDFTRSPYAIFKFDNAITRSELTVIPEIINYPDLLAINRVCENEKYFFLTVQKGIHGGIRQELIQMVFDKNSGKLMPTNGFKNDLDTGMNFWPQWISNEFLVAYYPAYAVLDYIEQAKSSGLDLSQGFIDLAKDLNEYDNPVVVLIK